MDNSNNTTSLYTPEALYEIGTRLASKLHISKKWQDDAVAEFVAAAYEAGVEAATTAKAYQYTRGMGAMMDFIRREKRHERLSPASCPHEAQRESLDKLVSGMDDEPTTLAEIIVDKTAPWSDASCLLEERKEAVNLALMSLPDAQINAVVKILIQGKSQREAASEMGVTRKELRFLLEAGQGNLKNALEKYKY